MSSLVTGEYHTRLNDGVNAHRDGHASAEVVLYFAVIEDCIRCGTRDRAATSLIDKAQRLERAGAQYLILATNTLHRVAPELDAAVGIALVHIAGVTAETARADSAEALGLPATAPVMEEGFCRDRFAGHGFEVLIPPAPDRELVHRVNFDQLTRGVVSDASRGSSCESLGRPARPWRAGHRAGLHRELPAGLASGPAAGDADDTTCRYVDRVRRSLGLDPLSG